MNETRTTGTGYLMVLNDGETYTDLKGCSIIEANAEVLEEYYGRIDDLASGPTSRVVVQFGDTPPAVLASALFDGDPVPLELVEPSAVAAALHDLADRVQAASAVAVAEVAALWLPSLEQLVAPPPSGT